MTMRVGEKEGKRNSEENNTRMREGKKKPRKKKINGSGTYFCRETISSMINYCARMAGKRNGQRYITSGVILRIQQSHLHGYLLCGYVFRLLG